MQDNHITICNGNLFKFSDPNACDFEIHEIAHALSQICRFAGHTKTFYSVAQHSVHVSDLVPDYLKMEALMHDAHEAFVGDIPTPLKKMLPDYRLIEEHVEKAIRRKYGLPLGMADDVKTADHQMFILERNSLMPASEKNQLDLDETNIDMTKIIPLTPIQSYHFFMARYRKLSKKET